MIHRVVITGAESTGKTTLAQALANYYSEPWTHEFVREYAGQLDRALQPEDLEPIARGQLATEDAALKTAQRLIIHDTNLLSSIIYAKHYFDAEISQVNDQFQARNYSLYLFCMPDFPWEADEGQRDSALARSVLHNTFKDQLNKMKLPHMEIRGPQQERLRQAVFVINKILNI